MRNGARLSVCAAIALFLGTSAVPRCYGDFTFTEKNVPQTNEENILFQAKEEGKTIVGDIDHLLLPATFTSSQFLIQQSQGQADIHAEDALGGNLIPITDMHITMDPAFTPWEDAILNMRDGTGKVTVTVNEGLADEASHTMTLKNGQNFLTIVAINGESIKTIDISATDGFTDLRQPRVSSPQFHALPEPTSMALCGIGALGFGGFTWIRRRKLGIV